MLSNLFYGHQLIGYIRPENDIESIHHLTSGYQISDVHCKPWVSVKEGFKCMRSDTISSKKTRKK